MGLRVGVGCDQKRVYMVRGRNERRLERRSLQGEGEERKGHGRGPSERLGVWNGRQRKLDSVRSRRGTERSCVTVVHLPTEGDQAEDGVTVCTTNDNTS